MQKNEIPRKVTSAAKKKTVEDACSIEKGASLLFF